MHEAPRVATNDDCSLIRVTAPFVTIVGQDRVAIFHGGALEWLPMQSADRFVVTCRASIYRDNATPT